MNNAFWEMNRMFSFAPVLIIWECTMQELYGKRFAFLIVPKASLDYFGESEIFASLWQQFEPH